jgi:PilZ domain
MAKPTSSSTVPAAKTADNRRRFPRRGTPFQGVYYRQTGERIPIVGLDFSGGGLSVLVQNRIEDVASDLTIGGVIDGKPFSLSGRIRWADTVKVKGVDHFRYGVKLAQIADGDWIGSCFGR